VKQFFITGTGTGVGKTLVVAALTRQLRRAGTSVRAVKPVISGYTPATHRGSDTALLLAGLGADPSPEAIDRVSPFRFAAPLSPDMAAAREGRRLDYDALLHFCRACTAGPEDVLLIEGVGGIMVPLTEDKTVLDWIAATEAPCLLVAGSYLGTISHTLTAASVLRQRGIALAGLVLSESEESPVPPGETGATIERFLPGTRIAVVPRLRADRPWQGAPDLTFLLA
jgi:dethiobiotin synthetase